jgi:hypothetical protein
MLEWRGVEDPCEMCGGSGVVSYANTSTWRHGFGGQAITNGVCDSCWGSGDKHHPWENLRKLRDEEQQRIASAALELFARRVGSQVPSLKPAIQELCKVLDREARRRKPPAPYWEQVCSGLSKVLQEAKPKEPGKWRVTFLPGATYSMDSIEEAATNCANRGVQASVSDNTGLIVATINSSGNVMWWRKQDEK